MADKEQIIIDGVNVKRCEFAEESATTPKCRINDYIHCDGYTCYYKQLQRKTAECEELQKLCQNQAKTINDLTGCVGLWEEFSEEESELAKNSSIADLVVLLRQKTAECEALKEKYKWYDHYKDSALANKDLCNKKIDEIGRCREALEEIKGIACNEMCDMLGHFCAGCDDKPSCKTLKILDIISKVKGDK